jgi:rubrerythrin
MIRDEYAELLENAIYKEIASEAFYLASKRKAADAATATLLEELAEGEKQHIRWLTRLKNRKRPAGWQPRVTDELKIGEYLTAPDTIDEAGLQDILIFAIKKEQQSIDFYSRMTGLLRTRLAKNLCRKLVNEEMRHKMKLELLYDSLFLKEN